MKHSYSLALFSASLLLFSCKKSKTEIPVVEIPIKTAAFAIKDINLTERANWILTGGGLRYTFNIVADTLRRFPSGNSYLLRYEPSNYSFNYIGFGLISPSYYKLPPAFVNRTVYATSPATEIFPNITDQSNEAKLTAADALIAINYKTPTSHIKDGQFIHRNTLIDFETVNIPDEAVVTVLQNEGTKPWHYKTGFYKTIVVAVPVISVKIGSDVHKVEVIDPRGMSANTLYTFKVVYDAGKKAISIIDLASKTWSVIH